jgi:protein-tyrosine-phosphatase
MAEAFLRHHAGDRFEAYNAGCNVGEEIYPYAVEVMEKVGIATSATSTPRASGPTWARWASTTRSSCAPVPRGLPQDLPRC